MQIVWGIVVLVLSLFAWVGQTIVWLAPATGERLGLSEAEADVEPTYWADIRGEARWDFFSLWTMVVAGILLIIGHAAWPYFGLVGGGMYLYFCGRGVFTRVAIKRRGFRVGAARNLRVAYTFLTIWGVMALITIGAAVVALR
jgi:hypothetical protein